MHEARVPGKRERLWSLFFFGDFSSLVGGSLDLFSRPRPQKHQKKLSVKQTSTGCAKSQWRFDHPTGYLRKILTARVYDVASVTPLERAPRLSERISQGGGGSKGGSSKKGSSSSSSSSSSSPPSAPHRRPRRKVEVWLKREDLQPVFSFKLRGAYNKMARLGPEERARGVVCSSAGNHAQGVALAASRLGCEATICMPTPTPEIKVAAVRRLGGKVVLVGDSYTETQAAAQKLAVEKGLAFVAPYDDPYTIAGQGTVGAEILRQLPTLPEGEVVVGGGDGGVGGNGNNGNGNASTATAASTSDLGVEGQSLGALDRLHAVFVPIGGGGLAAGVAAYIKALRPEVLVIGVEPSGANCMSISLAKGQRATLSKVDAFADGVAVKTVGAETFRLCREYLDGVVLVSNSAVSAAIKDVFNDTRSILEPAGAVAVAGAKAYLERKLAEEEEEEMEESSSSSSAAAGGSPFSSEDPLTVVASTSGANMNFATLRRVAELAEVGGATEATLATTMPEVPGSFLRFVEAALSPSSSSGSGGEKSSSSSSGSGTNAIDDADVQITEVKYRARGGSGGKAGGATPPPPAHVLWSAEAATPGQAASLAQRVRDAGFETVDLSNLDAAQVHLRHLVGGRRRRDENDENDENDDDEVIMTVDFPERKGALRAFLRAVSPTWNVTLFHYRAAGSTATQALLGVQIPRGQRSDFDAATGALGPEFSFTPLEGEARAAFEMFLG